MKKLLVLFFLVIAGIAFAQCQANNAPSVKSTESIPEKLPDGMPSWTAYPRQYGVQTYDADGWVYVTAFSHKTASESSARSQARQDIQRAVAEYITEKLSSDEISFLKSLKIKDPKRAVSNSIIIRLPAHEVLEWHIVSGKVNDSEKDNSKENENDAATEYYIAYIFVRFPRDNFLEALDRIDPEKVVEGVLKNEKIKEKSISDKNRTKFVDIVKAGIRDGKKKYTE